MENDPVDTNGQMNENSGAHTWILRLADEPDVERALAQLGSHMNDTQRRAFRDKLLRYVRKRDRDLILAIKHDLVLGLACVIEESEVPPSIPSPLPGDLRNYAALTQLMVHPGVRRQGIGSSLLIGAEQWALARGKAGLWLVTHRMAQWYQRHFAYREAGRMSAKGVEKWIMVKGLEHEVPHPSLRGVTHR
jgi:GNAT superfamily N-acetyltransferase